MKRGKWFWDYEAKEAKSYAKSKGIKLWKIEFKIGGFGFYANKKQSKANLEDEKRGRIKIKELKV